jgi:hypothetical protein
MKKSRKKEKMNIKTNVSGLLTNAAIGSNVKKKEIYRPYKAKKGTPDQEQQAIRMLRNLRRGNKSN